MSSGVNMLVRDYELSDLTIVTPSVTNLISLYLPTLSDCTLKELGYATYESDIIDFDIKYNVALLDGVVKGFISYMPSPSGRTIIKEIIAIDKKRGIGSMLIDSIIYEDTRELFVISLDADNVSFYLNYGFHIWTRNSHRANIVYSELKYDVVK